MQSTEFINIYINLFSLTKSIMSLLSLHDSGYKSSLPLPF